jgi:phosphate transport system substrate-binding protein
MRTTFKALIAAGTVATLATLGVSAAAQAQTAAPGAHQVKRQVEVIEIPAHIPFSVIVVLVKGATSPCTNVKASGLPGPVTAGTSAKVNDGCSAEVEGVDPNASPATLKPKFTYTQGGTSHTLIVIITVFPEPCENDAVGVGSDTITPLTDQLATDYNNTLGIHPACSKVKTTSPFEYSWDAVNPITGQIGDSIPVKQDCSPIVRPDGSSAGISALALFTKSSSGPFCVNFARSSRPRASTDPPFGPGGVAFVSLAGDAVTWSVPKINTAAPKTLTVAQLNAIYTCTDTNWDQVGGKNQAIAPFLPQSGSGTLSFFLAAIGVTTPGPCVSNNNNMLEENEGTNPVLQNKGGIFPYSVGDWIAQNFHGAPCLNRPSCKPNSAGVVCIKLPGLDQYICIINGTMQLREINGVAPTVGSGTGTKINPAFPSTFDRTLFDVVPWDPATTDHIPGATKPVGGLDLEGIFGASGFDCHSAAAKADIAAYGFINLKTCGATS